MFEPRTFQPFGPRGPKVMVFGRPANWSMNRLQKEGDHQSETGLYFRLCRLGEEYHFPQLLAPSPVEFNTKICTLEDLGVRIQNGACSVTIHRGYNADGVLLRHGQVGAIPTADCPTIVAYCQTTRQAIMAHAGLGSLVDLAHLKGGQPLREHWSVVDALMQKSLDLGFLTTQVFVTCGIKEYQHRDLAPLLIRYYPDTRIVEGSYVDLRLLIREQFAAHNIYTVTYDGIDTYHDRFHGQFMWHSYRRDRTPERNLVLVLNNSFL